MKRFLIAILSLSCLCASANITKPRAATRPPVTQGISLTKADASAPVRASQSSALFESFEGPGDKTWLPDGWTRKTDSSSTDPEYHWFNYGSMTGVAHPVDGSRFMAVMYDSEYKDEWIISPEVSVAAGQGLSFYWWTQPIYLFVIDRHHIDYDNGVFTNQEVAATLQIMVQPDGGEWVKVFDLSDLYMGVSYENLASTYYNAMQHATVDLSQFAGQTVKIGIRYVGTDGDSMFVDAMGIDLPALKARYEAPWYRQFLGFSYDTEMLFSRTSAEYYPVNEKITWSNLSFGNPDATTYEWAYTDPDGDMVTATGDDLQATYQPCYDPTAVYSTPVLMAGCDGYADTSYQGPTHWLRAGGTPCIPTADGSPLRTGIWSMDANRDGIFAYTVDGADFGDPSIPVFGYSADTDQWWSNYVSPSGTYQAQLDAYLNVLIVPDSPMVIDGAVAYGIGAVGNGAEFTLEIYALRGEYMVPDSRPLASAKCRGDKMARYDWSTRYKLLAIPFEFDEPVVISGRDATAYAVYVKGFRGPDVEWFAPMMAERPNELDICYAQYVCHITGGGEEFDNFYMTAYFQNDEGQDLFSTFAISLGAFYPWLETADTDVTLDGTATVTLGSSYAADALTITAKDAKPLPDWLTATITGEADDITLTLTGTPDDDTDIAIEVTAPGVKQFIDVHAKTASLSALSLGTSDIVAVYTLTGIPVAKPSVPGIYLVRYADGTIAKTALK